VIKTYPEMNAKIKDLLRIGYDETDGDSGIFLYSAQRIEELEAENDLLRKQLFDVIKSTLPGGVDK